MKLKFWIGIVISVVCLYFVFRNIDITKVLETLRSVNYFYIVIAVLLQLSTIWLRAERWKYLLAPIKKLTFQHLVPATMIGFMANNILPARAGEFIRAYVIGKKERISKTSSFATIIIERVCDMITMLLFLVVILLLVRFPPAGPNPTNSSSISLALLQKVGALSAVFVFGLVVFLVLLKEFPQKTTTIVQKMLTPFPASLSSKALQLFESFRLGLQVLNTGMHLFFLVVWSLSVWLAAVAAAWAVLGAFDLNLSFMAAMFITVLTAFSVAIPSSPGYIGPFHAAVSASVLFFIPTLDKSTAAGIAIVFHLVCVVPVTLAGIFYLWRENMSFAEIQHIEEDQDQQELSGAPSVDG